MKKAIIGVFAMFLSVGAFAQNINFSQFQSTFKTFAKAVSSALPFNSTIGLNWSEAYIGNFPHLGIGVTAGATTMPISALDQVTQSLGLSSVSSMLPTSVGNLVNTYGVPIPGYTVDARIGGLVLPFDIGLKLGYLGNKFDPLQSVLGSSVHLNYLLAGFDLRFRVIKEGTFVPNISIGGGFNYLKGDINYSTGSGTIKLLSLPNPSSPTGYTDISMTAPDLSFNWESKVFDAKIQISKHILIFTPYIGAGASYGISSAGGGLQTTVDINGQPATQQQINEINQGLTALTGQTYNFTSQGIIQYAGANGFGARVFGGLSIDVLILHADIGVAYDFLAHEYGATASVRVQF